MIFTFLHRPYCEQFFKEIPCIEEIVPMKTVDNLRFIFDLGNKINL